MKNIVITHFDVHGVCAGALAAQKFSADEIYSRYPQTSPEALIETIRNLYFASTTKLKIFVVDIPVNLKSPESFVAGLEEIANKHDVFFLDHHETTLPYLARFERVRPTFVGTSALQLDLALLPDNSEIFKKLAIIGAIGDRDPEVVRRGLLNNELRNISDGLDVLVRKDALEVVKKLVSEPESILQEAITEAEKIPTATLESNKGLVTLSKKLEEKWSLKSLEKLAFQENAWYAVGYTYVSRFNQWVVRAIARWDILANKNIPLPGEIAKKLLPTRTIIGHPAAPSIAVVDEKEAIEVSDKLADALQEGLMGATTPKTVELINTKAVGSMFAEVLMRLTKILEEQRKMYDEYLKLKKRQVELLEETGDRRYD